MLLVKIKNLMFYSITIAIIFELIFGKIETNKLDKLHNYPSLNEKILIKNTNEIKSDFSRKPNKLNDVITIKIGILANPEPINELYNNDKISPDSNNTRKGIFNSTYVNWLNNSINSEFIIKEIKNNFNYSLEIDLKIKIEFIPLLFWQNDSTIDDLLSKINGVLFIGGDRDVDFKNEWENYSIKLMNKIIKLQKTDRKIPLWGICQGIEMIHAILVNTTNVLEKFSSWNLMQNIEISDFKDLENKKRSIYFYLNDNEKNFLMKEKSTVHYHNLGISPESYKNKDFSILKQMFQISAFGYDSNGKKFINSVESYEPYNIFAVQYHPEKNPIKKMKNLRESNEEYLNKFNIINKKITINYFIKVIEDLLLVNNMNNKIEHNKKNFNENEISKKLEITNGNIIENFKGSPIPVYLFSE